MSNTPIAPSSGTSTSSSPVRTVQQVQMKQPIQLMNLPVTAAQYQQMLAIFPEIANLTAMGTLAGISFRPDPSTGDAFLNVSISPK